MRTNFNSMAFSALIVGLFAWFGGGRKILEGAVRRKLAHRLRENQLCVTDVNIEPIIRTQATRSFKEVERLQTICTRLD